MKNTLLDLESKMRLAKSPLIEIANKGQRPDAIKASFDSIGLIPTNELIDLYEWHDGVDISRNYYVNFFGKNGNWLPLKEAIKYYKGFYAESTEEEWFMIENEAVGKYLFPISHDDDFLVFLKPDSKYYGAVFTVSPGLLIIQPRMIFDSLEKMCVSIAACYRLGHYSTIQKPDGYYDEHLDFHASFDVFKKYNPISEYWKRERLVE
ncbi:MAG: hypothetical protein JNM22_20590 [Saprospiraceae bacterium]|nr:hypothetical protein [Saprospiraceae bacterium]